MPPWSQRGGSGRERAERPGNGTPRPRRVHGRVGNTGGRGWKREPWGDAKNGPPGWACAHAQRYAVPGPEKGREPRTAATSPTGSRVRAGPRPGWVGAAPCPRSGCAPGRAQGEASALPSAPGPARACRPHAGLPPRRVLSAPGSGNCSPRANTSRDLAPPPEAARLGGLSSSSAVRGGGGRGSGKRNQGRGGEFRGVREGEGDKEKGVGCALHLSSLLCPDQRPWPLWGPCALIPLSSLVPRFRGTNV